LTGFQDPQQDPNAQRNMLLAFALAFLIIVASQPLMKKYGPKPPEPAPVTVTPICPIRVYRIQRPIPHISIPVPALRIVLIRRRDSRRVGREEAALACTVLAFRKIDNTVDQIAAAATLWVENQAGGPADDRVTTAGNVATSLAIAASRR